MSLPLLEAMEEDGWAITLTKWSVGEERRPRAPSGSYEAGTDPVGEAASQASHLKGPLSCASEAINEAKDC